MGRTKSGKYDRKYCKQLTRGMRKDGMSIPEVCQEWGISKTTYYAWIEAYPEFKRAHDFGNRDCMAFWHKLNRAVASGQVKGNAGVICFSMKNIEGIGWKDKTEVENIGMEPVKQINISILPSPNKVLEDKTKIIEHEDNG